MKTVIPAAGEGTRLRPHTEDKPKAMVEVAGRPLIEHLMDSVIDHTSEFVIVIGYEGGQIFDHIGHEYRGTPVKYGIQQERVGLAHAILKADSALDGDRFAVILGDSYHHGDLTPAYDALGDKDGVIMVEEVPEEEARRYGVIEESDGQIVDIVEKPDDPPSNKVLTGFAILPPEFLGACYMIRPSERGELEWTDAMNVLLTAGLDLKPVQFDGYRVDVGYPDDLDELNEHL